MTEEKNPSWEQLAKQSREIAYQRRAALQQIYKVTNDNMPEEERIDRIRDIVKLCGVYLDE